MNIKHVYHQIKYVDNTIKQNQFMCNISGGDN